MSVRMTVEVEIERDNEGDGVIVAINGRDVNSDWVGAPARSHCKQSYFTEDALDRAGVEWPTPPTPAEMFNELSKAVTEAIGTLNDAADRFFADAARELS